MAQRPTIHRGYIRGGPGDEVDLLGCGHCQRQLEVKPGQVSVPVDFCRSCMRFICAPCNKALQSGTCVTWEAMIERMEREGAERARVRREYQIETG